MTPLLASFFGDIWGFFDNADHWSGEDGIPRLLGQHVELTLVSTLVAAVIALPIGIVLGHVRRGGALAINLANVGRALPALALLVLAVQWVGIGKVNEGIPLVHSLPAFLAMVAIAMPPMLANAYVGLANVDDEVREAAQGMGMNGRQVLWRVELPMALPLVMAGVRTAVVAVVATATLAAYVDGGGLGSYIATGIAVRDNTRVFAGGLLVALLAIVLELGLGLLQRLLVSRGLRTGGERIAREIEDELTEAGLDPALP